MLEFGVELEVADISFETAENIFKKLGFSYWSEDNYDIWLRASEIHRKWVCKGDCTIAPDGVEFNSPILTWPQRLQMMPLIKEIKKSGAYCNDSCGIHIHVSGDFPPYEDCVSIFKKWYDRNKKEFEPCPRRKKAYCQDIYQFINDYDDQHLEIRLFDAKLDCRYMSRCLTVCRQLGAALERINN